MMMFLSSLSLHACDDIFRPIFSLFLFYATSISPYLFSFVEPGLTSNLGRNREIRIFGIRGILGIAYLGEFMGITCLVELLGIICDGYGVLLLL